MNKQVYKLITIFFLLGIFINCNILSASGQAIGKYTDAEGDALVARLGAAEKKIVNLQQMLDQCLSRPAPPRNGMRMDGKPVLAIITFALEYTNLTAKDKDILNRVARVMTQNNNQYVIAGYIHGYTGGENSNAIVNITRIRNIENFLISRGVHPNKIKIVTHSKPSSDLGLMGDLIIGAVTISEAD